MPCGEVPCPPAPGSSQRGWASAERHAPRVHVDRVDRLATRDEQAIALGPAEAQVGAALGQEYAPDELALGVPDSHAVVPFAAAPAAPEVALGVDAEAVGNAGPAVDEHLSVRHPRAVVDHVVDADLARHRA